MSSEHATEAINCPCCDGSEAKPWSEENGFTAVRCTSCSLVYVNPRPVADLIDEAVKTGVHTDVDHGRTAIARRNPLAVQRYQKILGSMYADTWQRAQPVSWLDIGAGYGEVLEALTGLAPKGSRIEGLEPMAPKREAARQRGLSMREGFLSAMEDKFDFVSLVNVFSHIPDFNDFLDDVKNVLNEGGEFFIETGNIGDLEPKEVPTELDLPDHLVFAGVQNIEDFLKRAGFSVVNIQTARIDGPVRVAKNLAKKILGRKVALSLPYTSRYRTVMIRAQLNSAVRKSGQ